jgi:carboxypeptidase Q
MASLPPLASLPLLLALVGPLSAQGDPETIERILVEGKEHSQVWATLAHLSDDIGTRLTGSTRLTKANEWARDEFQRLGLEAHLFQWGTVPVGFDRGPSHARMVAPSTREFEFTTASYGAGTNGPVRAPVRALPTTMAELEEVGFDLEDCWILCPDDTDGFRRGGESPAAKAAREERAKIDAALAELHIAGRLVSTSGELVLTGAVSRWRELTMATLPKDVVVQIRKSDHDAVYEALGSGSEVMVEVDLQHRFVEGPVPVYNTIAEIRGTEKPEEVVIVSGHLDTWDGPGSKGTQDNGTGSAVTLETARILMAAGAKPKRTIRFCLWTGEEQGLLGSMAYVSSLSDEEKQRISACFVDDGGTNYQGGLVCLTAQKELLDAAITPVQAAFPELPMENHARERMGGGGGSDHFSFNQAGIPGFFWNESGSGGREGKSYEFVHHTQHDTERYAVEEYLVQSASCSAVVAYQLAMMDSLLPREDPKAKLSGPAADPSFQLVQSPLSGEWEISFLDPDAPDFRFQVALETAKDGRLRGTASAMGNLDVLKAGKWDVATKAATFQSVTDFGQVDYDVHLEAGELRGTLVAMGRPMQIRGAPKPFAQTPVSGLWSGTIPAMSDAKIALYLQVREGGELVGRFQSAQSDSALYAGKWDAEAKSLSFEYDYPRGGRVPVTVRLEGEQLRGKIGERADFTAVRAPAE